MPLWKVIHPTGCFSNEDKQTIARGITAIYRPLPKFYVGVVFEAVAKDDFYVGGEPADDFVRVWVDHIARRFDDDEDMKARFLAGCAKVFGPFTTARNLRWEMHVDETPFTLWTIGGMRPPPPNSPAEQRWKADNRATPYED